ncbi:hypothetical protein ACFLSA_06825 [Bacteroidota bacterium]
MVILFCVVTSKITIGVGLNRPTFFLFFYRTTVKNYNVTGNHILATDSLKTDIENIFHFEGIPYFFLIDEKGEIAGKNMARPSQFSKLKQQINNCLN